MSETGARLVFGFQEGIKTGLAASLALGLAYAMGWSEPIWAGLSALVVHMGPVGASTFKGLNRILGTLLAAVVALAFLALFSQARWGFMGAMCLWLLFSGYKSLTSNYAYLWMKACVVVMLLVVHSQLDSLASFEVVVSRSQTTILGVIVHYFVDAFLWPRKTRPEMLTAIRDDIRLQNEITRDFFTQKFAVRDKNIVSDRPRRFLKGVARFSQLADQRLLEDQRAIEERHAWRHIVQIARRIVEIQGRIAHAIAYYGDGNPLLTAFLGQEAFLAEMNDRARRLDELFARGPGPASQRREPKPVAIALRREALALANEDQRRLLVVLLTQVNDLGARHARLARLVEDVFCEDAPLPKTSPAAEEKPGLDPEALRLTLCLVAIFCFFFLMNMYTRIPNGPGGIYLAMLFMLQAVISPRTKPRDLLPSFLLGSVMAVILYILVLPKLTEFYQLCICLTISFCLSWTLFMKQFGKWPCVMMIIYCESAFESPPTYDIMNIVNLTVVLFIFMTAAYVVTEWIYPMRPESMFLAINRWYYATAARHAPRSERLETVRGRLCRFLRLRTMRPLALAQRMEGVAARIDPKRLPGQDRRTVMEYVDSAHLLAFHLGALRRDHQALAANASLRAHVLAAEGRLDELRRVLDCFVSASQDWIVEKTEAIVSGMTGQSPVAAGQGAAKLEALLPWGDVFRFDHSLRIVANDIVSAKRIHEKLRVEELAASRF